MILGADTDLNGAIVLLDENGKYVNCLNIPTMAHNSPVGVLKRRVDCAQLEWQLALLCGHHHITAAYCEYPGVTPSNGPHRIASQHRTLGNIEACINNAAIPVELVQVRAWKGNFGLIGKPKKAAISIANELCCMYVEKVKDATIAEAALIARYGMRMKAQQALKENAR